MCQARHTVKAFSGYFDALLNTKNIHDASNNGLQIEASEEVRRLGFAVDARLETLEKAAGLGIGLLFVHHGLSWGDGVKYFTGHVGEMLALAYRRGVSLYACHLPLDLHPDLGNNAGLARLFDLENMREEFPWHGEVIGCAGDFRRETPLADVATTLAAGLGISPADIRVHPGEKASCRHIGFVSGGGGGSVEQCQEAGIDTLVTGELLHHQGILAKECGISVIVAGHYATETVGPKAVMQRVMADFPDVPCSFINAPTGL